VFKLLVVSKALEAILFASASLAQQERTLVLAAKKAATPPVIQDKCQVTIKIK
jgi:hypothetical protein